MIVSPILRMQFLELQERERARQRRRRIFSRRYWVHPVNAIRPRLGAFQALYLQLRTFPDKFQRYVRMAPSSFDVLLEIVCDDIQRQDTHLRFAVSPEQHLVVTLR